MANLTDEHLSVARRLLQQEAAGEHRGGYAAAAGRVYEILSRQLAPVIGSAGVRALFARCLKLNRGRFPCLEMRLPAEAGERDGQVAKGLVSALQPLGDDGAQEVAIALYATFFALLTTFIGERVTWQIVHRAFAEDDGTASKETE